ncbi:hypothetical protein J22TS3_19950 [Paenibacillus sp. J22TS3]|nr:hypothetical protein J22TS3_19950 [Paenibacillus sp. J22TS3]
MDEATPTRALTGTRIIISGKNLPAATTCVIAQKVCAAATGNRIRLRISLPSGYVTLGLTTYPERSELKCSKN